MFDEATILARLQNGEDAQKIADEMAAALNKVNKIYADQKAKEEADRVAAKRAEVQKKEDLQKILDMFADWFKTYYDIEAKSALETETVLELIDSVKEYVEALKGLESLFDIKKPAAPVGTKIIKSNTKPKSADEQISDFLNKMGW